MLAPRTVHGTVPRPHVVGLAKLAQRLCQQRLKDLCTPSRSFSHPGQVAVLIPCRPFTFAVRVRISVASAYSTARSLSSGDQKRVTVCDTSHGR